MTAMWLWDISFNLDEQFDTIISELPVWNDSNRTINSFGKSFINLIQTSGLIKLIERTIGDVFGAHQPAYDEMGSALLIIWVLLAVYFSKSGTI